MSVAAYAAGWGLWILVVLLALFAWHTVLVDVLVGRRVRFINTASAVVLTWLANWFVILDQLDKLHLLWILPTVFIALDFLRPGSDPPAIRHRRSETATPPPKQTEDLSRVNPSP